MHFDALSGNAASMMGARKCRDLQHFRISMHRRESVGC
jgi:hypothetical protein